jgi:tetratricopeptide (TPR) repeat protein
MKNTQEVKEDAMSYYNKGLAYYDVENHEQAIACYQKAVSLDPNFAEAYYKMGRAYSFGIGSHEQVISCYQKVVSIDPNHAQAYSYMGDAYSSLENYEQAIGCYQKAVSIDPNFTDAYCDMGFAYEDLNDYKQAISCFEQVLRIDPNNEMAYLFMGLAYDKLKNYEQVIVCYQKMVDFDPNDATAYVYMGDAYKKLENYELSIGCYKQAGNAYSLLEVYEKAIGCYKDVLRIDPNDAEAHYHMGNAYYELKNYEQALSCYEKALSIDPNYAEAYYRMGLTYYHLGNEKQQITYYQKAAKLGDADAQEWLKKNMQNPESTPSPVPCHYSYEVVPQKFYAGEYPGNPNASKAKEKVATLVKFGITHFVDLTEADELKPYAPYLPTGIGHRRFAITDPQLAPLDLMHAIVTHIETLLADGQCVYLHCHGGIDRTGGVVACWFAHCGMPAHEAMRQYKTRWETNPKLKKTYWTPAIQKQPDYIQKFIDFEQNIAANNSNSKFNVD